MNFTGGWIAMHLDENQWIQANFGDPVRITAIVTQGRDSFTWIEWITSYKVKHMINK